MPHLSPMLWIVTPSIFIIILLMFTSLFWWSQYPYISLMTTSNTIKSLPWNWN